MPLQIINRRDYLHNWAAREAESPAKGNLRRGEIAIAIVTDDGTDNGNITEVIGRIGPSDTPTPFSDCPVVFRSPRGFKGADVRPVLVDDAPATNAVLAYDNAAGKFVTVNEDPGTYEEVDGTEGGGEGGENELEEIAPTILTVQAAGLASQAVVDTNPTYTLTLNVIGRPDPILDIEIEETAWPDYDGNAQNFTTTTAASFSTDAPPQSVTVSVADSSESGLAALGARTYVIAGLVVNRSVPMSRVAINARIGASNPAGSSPVSVYGTSGQIEFIADPTEAAQAPAISSVVISEGGQATNKIANLATGGTATLTASYVATDFAEGVDNGTVTYQWYEGDAALVGETNASITITNDADRYNDSQLSVQVSISDLDGSDSRRGYIAIGDYDEGFTDLTPSADSRLIYVATDGDDTAAAAAKGRGYYLSSDPEIGPDPTNPVGPIAAYASPVEAVKRIRGGKWDGTDQSNGIPNYSNFSLPNVGYPDWLLFRRSQTFTIPDVNTAWGVSSWTIGQMLGRWYDSENRFTWRTGAPSGRSASERMVVTSWGPLSEPRPVIDRLGIDGRVANQAFVSLESEQGLGWWRSSDGLTCANLLVEDVKVRSFGAVDTVVLPNAVFRRCTVVDSFSDSGHNQGFYVAGNDTIVIEECVLDRNGYKEDPNEPTTWTGSVWSDGLAAGTGVQPRRTYFDRNLYLSSYADMKVRGNIISRGGGGGSVQMRQGGVAERNLFIWNQASLGMGHPQASDHMGCLAVRNTVLHDDIWLPPGGWGHGIGVSGWSDDIAVADDNIVAHFHRGQNGGASLSAGGKTSSSVVPETEYLAHAFILNNAVYREYSGNTFPSYGTYLPRTDLDGAVVAATVSNNAISLAGGGILGLQGDPSKPATYTYTGNKYHTNSGAGSFRWDFQSNFRQQPHTNGTLGDWQAAGFDSDATFTNDFEAFKASVGWIEPERDIVSYMQAVDPTYVVNEDVYVDDGASGTKQAVRQKVWEVLNSELGEARAKQAARRYHAFLTFIEKARANRKGAWDSRWTADAVGNYIREGFGKAAVGGSYTASMSDLGAYA